MGDAGGRESAKLSLSSHLQNARCTSRGEPQLLGSCSSYIAAHDDDSDSKTERKKASYRSSGKQVQDANERFLK